MSNRRVTNFLMGAVALLLLANLVRPLFEPTTAFADDDDKPSTALMTGSGPNAWILKDNKIYYLKWDHSFAKVQIFGPEVLDRNDYGPQEPLLMNGTGNAVWILKGEEVFYVNAKIDASFVTIEIERPEALPE